MFGTYFYNETIKRSISIFGTLFNNIYTKKVKSDGTVLSQNLVPISYGPKQKFLQRLAEEPNLSDNNRTALSLPDAINDDEYLIIECYRKLDPTDFTDIYNDMWLKRYSTALVKYQWGENLSKFQGIQLPGGVQLDGSQMKQEAQEEITRLEEESRLNYEMPVMDMIG